MKTIELFGNIYKEVEDSCREYECKSCALLEICNITKPNLPCKKVDGRTNRHFVLVDDEKPMEKRDLELEDRVFSGELELKSGKKLKIILLVGGLKSDNPAEYMNDVVKRFGVKEFEGKYNEFIDSTLDKPWVRLLISNINDITDDDFVPLKERIDEVPDSDDIIKMIKGADKDTLAKIEQYIKKLKE